VQLHVSERRACAARSGSTQRKVPRGRDDNWPPSKIFHSPRSLGNSIFANQGRPAFRRMGASTTRRVIRVALLLILIVVAWGYGLAVRHYEWPPFALIRSAYKTLRSVPAVPAVSLSTYEMRAPILAAFPTHRVRAVERHVPWHGHCPIGISGNMVDGVVARVLSILASRAKKAFVMIGINDLRKGQSVVDHSDISQTRGGPWG
jgi:hypothetical protein